MKAVWPTAVFAGKMSLPVYGRIGGHAWVWKAGQQCLILCWYLTLQRSIHALHSCYQFWNKKKGLLNVVRLWVHHESECPLTVCYSEAILCKYNAIVTKPQWLKHCDMSILDFWQSGNISLLEYSGSSSSCLCWHSIGRVGSSVKKILTCFTMTTATAATFAELPGVDDVPHCTECSAPVPTAWSFCCFSTSCIWRMRCCLRESSEFSVFRAHVWTPSMAWWVWCLHRISTSGLKSRSSVISSPSLSGFDISSSAWNGGSVLIQSCSCWDSSATNLSMCSSPICDKLCLSN